jgi:glycosyltransferase involved in cell wall biosynthesis
MTILFGHPTGNPNSHNAALAYLDAGELECFCVSWMPTATTIRLLKQIRQLRGPAKRLERRVFMPLAEVPKVQGRIGEIYRLLMRTFVLGGYPSEQANRWLMRTMAKECRRKMVSAVHAYEDCSLWPFLEAKRLGKACIYDLPTCYYPAWESIQDQLKTKYCDWMPQQRLSAADVHLEQKRRELELADLTLVASRYVEESIRDVYPQKEVALAPYGVDVEFWTPENVRKTAEPLRFIYAGNVSVRKGIPLLIEAWSKAGLRDSELALVGSWGLADHKLRSLPAGVRWIPPRSSEALRDLFRESHVFLFPSYSDGFGLVLLEAMACGLPAIASDASVGPEIITSRCGFICPAGDLEKLVGLLRWCDNNRDELGVMGQEARAQAIRCTWSNYRNAVMSAVSKLI